METPLLTFLWISLFYVENEYQERRNKQQCTRIMSLLTDTDMFIHTLIWQKMEIYELAGVSVAMRVQNIS